MVICILEFIFDISTQQWEAACDPVVSPALSCRVHIMDFNLSGDEKSEATMPNHDYKIYTKM